MNKRYIRIIKRIIRLYKTKNSSTGFLDSPKSSRAKIFNDLIKWRWVKVVKTVDIYWVYVEPTPLLLSMKINDVKTT